MSAPSPTNALSRRAFLRRSALTAASVPAAATILSAIATPAARAATAPGKRAPIRVRKNVLDLTIGEKQDLVAAFVQLKRVPSPWNPAFNYYDQFVTWHKHAFDCEIAAAHMQPSFCPWHRRFLLLLEDALIDVSNGAVTALPYWDWTDPASTAAVFSTSLMGPAGEASAGFAVTQGAFRRARWRLNVLDPKSNDPNRYRWLVRRFGTEIAQQLPTANNVASTLATPNYDVAPFDPGSPIAQSFRNHLEGWKNALGMECTPQGLMNPVLGPKSKSIMHNQVHLYVGGIWGPENHPQLGTMVLNTSTNDPVFFLHHAQIDRLWDMWEQTHGMVYVPVSGLPPGQNLNDSMWPYNTIGDFTTIADLLDISDLGYTYA